MLLLSKVLHNVSQQLDGFQLPPKPPRVGFVPYAGVMPADDSLGGQFQPRLPGVQWHKGDFPAVGSFAAGARQYAAAQGLRYSRSGLSSVRADPNVINTLGRTVEQQQRATDITPEMRSSYEVFGEHIERQYAHLTKPESEGGM